MLLHCNHHHPRITAKKLPPPSTHRKQTRPRRRPQNCNDKGAAAEIEFKTSTTDILKPQATASSTTPLHPEKKALHIHSPVDILHHVAARTSTRQEDIRARPGLLVARWRIREERRVSHGAVTGGRSSGARSKPEKSRPDTSSERVYIGTGAHSSATVSFRRKIIFFCRFSSRKSPREQLSAMTDFNAGMKRYLWRSRSAWLAEF